MPRPGMSDGRVFTNYLPNCQMNKMMETSNGFSNNNQYKEYVQKNAKQVMEMFTSTVPEKPQGCLSV